MYINDECFDVLIDFNDECCDASIDFNVDRSDLGDGLKVDRLLVDLFALVDHFEEELKMKVGGHLLFFRRKLSQSAIHLSETPFRLSNFALEIRGPFYTGVFLSTHCIQVNFA